MFNGKQFPVKQSLNPWFVTGFIEGSGSFTYSRSGDSVIPYFALKVGAQDRSLLQGLQAFFGGGGRIYDVTAQASGTSAKAAYFRVTRASELALVVAHFERFPLLGAKADAFSLWRRLVAAKQRFRRPDRPGISAATQALSDIGGRRRGAGS